MCPLALYLNLRDELDGVLEFFCPSSQCGHVEYIFFLPFIINLTILVGIRTGGIK